jgi:hypothetical protein
MGRCNTHLKPHYLVFGPEGFARASEELAQQLLPMSEQIPWIVRSRGKRPSTKAIGLFVGQSSQYFHC